MKTKIGTEVAHVKRDSDTTFKVTRSKVNLQGVGHIVAASRTACYGNLSVETLSKIVLTDQHNTKTISVNTLLSREKRSECLSSPFTYSCQTISETRASFFINGLAENCPISSAVRLLIQKMF